MNSIWKILAFFISKELFKKLADDDHPWTIFIKIVIPIFLSLIIGSMTSLFISKDYTRGELLIIFSIIIFSFVNAALVQYLIVFLAKTTGEEGHIIKIAKAMTGGEVSPYKNCIDAVKNAKERILVIGAHFSMNGEISTTAHGDYLSQGLDMLLDSVGKNGDALKKNFVYKRIMQIEIEETDYVISRKQKLKGDAIGDRALCLHVQQALYLDSRGKLEVQIYARKFLPSFPSILIVDDKDVFFSLPYDKNYGSQINTFSNDEDVQRENCEFSIDFVLHLHDKSGKTALEFEHLFHQLRRGAFEVKEIEMPCE